jgi:hypothetical protein
MTSQEQHPAPAATWLPVDHAALAGVAFGALQRRAKCMTSRQFLEMLTRAWPAPILLPGVEQAARVAIPHHTPSPPTRARVALEAAGTDTEDLQEPPQTMDLPTQAAAGVVARITRQEGTVARA